jgi:arsenate reductase (thioredoxin)
LSRFRKSSSAVTRMPAFVFLLMFSGWTAGLVGQLPAPEHLRVAPQQDVLTEKGVRQASPRVRLERLSDYVGDRSREFGLIEPERREALLELVAYINTVKATGKPVRLTFICTANSRRSQLAEIWAATAAAHYDVPHIETYSGGTGVSAFNKRISRTLTGAGFEVIMRPGFNSQVQVRYSDREPPIFCYSKVHNDPVNPREDYIAVVLCDDAEEACPVMPGATYRVFIPYVDPRLSDHSDDEREAYHERNAQIAREMLFVMSRVN